MKLIECPRDAMQGFSSFIPTNIKIKYINELLKVGFDTIDVGSFVSKRQIPQLADTKEVLQRINLKDSKSKLLVITGNVRGAEEAAGFDEVTYIGFPFSISETFQKKNINSSINDSLVILDKIQNLCVKKNKKLVTYFSMAFGNPYGDEWSTYIVAHWAEKLLKDFGINILSLSDTIGSSDPSSISWLFSKLIREFPEVEFGAHLHSNSKEVKEKINAAYLAGCRRFDGALLGIGGCPMAKDQLIGNMPTEKIIDVLSNSGERLGINHDVL
ncbi:MAG: hydroxymethylglutaryl-CoA lyase, partial [Flavobacteriales bacterium]|nr:hydroxymethylglutaryl-CoA lyase [Flavobacteriales bacterium]